MAQRNFANKDTISVAIGFDKHSLNLAKMGLDLAKRTGCRLRLVHVCEPWLTNTYSYPLGDHTTLADVSTAIETNTVEIASNRLDEIVSGLGGGVKIEKNVVSSNSVADSLAADALVSNTLLTLLAFDGKPSWLNPAGWSTAMALMSTADTPVMIVPDQQKVDFSKKSFELLLADDLNKESFPAVDFSFELLSKLENAKINHFHVCGVTAENLSAALETAIATSHTTFSEDVSSSVILEDIDNRLKKTMKQRAEASLARLSNGQTRYSSTVRNGEVREELNKAIETGKPDTIVFGRHHTFHKRPFFLGRIPFHAMLGLGRPVIMVPNH